MHIISVSSLSNISPLIYPSNLYSHKKRIENSNKYWWNLTISGKWNESRYIQPDQNK